MISASAPSMTAKVTMAPITPPTAVEMPLPPLEEEEEELLGEEEV